MKSITKKKFDSLHKNYKTYIDGKPYILSNEKEGTCLIPVRITNKEDSQK